MTTTATPPPAASDMDLYKEANKVALDEWTEAQAKMPKDVAHLADKQSYLIAFKWGLWRGLMRGREHTAAAVKQAESERDGLLKAVERVEACTAPCDISSDRFTRDVAALQQFKAGSLDAWNYWHGGIRYAREQARAALRSGERGGE